jgi:hypothetical protein
VLHLFAPPHIVHQVEVVPFPANEGHIVSFPLPTNISVVYLASTTAFNILDGEFSRMFPMRYSQKIHAPPCRAVFEILVRFIRCVHRDHSASGLSHCSLDAYHEQVDTDGKPCQSSLLSRCCNFSVMSLAIFIKHAARRFVLRGARCTLRPRGTARAHELRIGVRKSVANRGNSA